MVVYKKKLFTNSDKIEQEHPTQVINNLDGELYAILFKGPFPEFYNDFGLVYDSLLNSRVPDSNIILLDSCVNRNRGYPATLEGIEDAVNSLREKVKTNDRFFFHTITHGDYRNKQAYFCGENSKIFEKDFEKIMQDLPFNFSLFYFAQCYSGPFAERMGYGSNIGMSNAAKRKSVSKRDFQKWSSNDFFTKHLFPGLLKKGKTIEHGFDDASWKMHNLPYFLLGLIYPPSILPNPAWQKPQLRWQNADPSKLHLISPQDKGI